MKKGNIFYLLLLVLFIGVIFKNWLFSPSIIGGDWPFFFQEYINRFSLLPPIWNSVLGNGLGGTSITYALDSYLYSTGWLFSVVFHIPWVVVYKIFWFGMFLVLSIYSSIFLFRTLFPKSLLWQQLLAASIYTTNTYILLVVGGGQMGVSLGYAISPLVLAAFIKIINNSNSKVLQQSLTAGLLFAVQVMFDFRMAYIVMGAAIVYFIFNSNYLLYKKNLLFSLLSFFVIPLVITLLLHAYWILPMLLTHFNPVASVGSAYTSLNSVKYFSFATFENALGLLHPYWPQNIFGKVGFMKPEFLIIPILAYASLLFIKYSRVILYVALLGLLGAFFAKGANDPFGFIYLWMFGHIPGFVMFRDPTKWYTLIAVSYSILIPFTVFSVYEWFNNTNKFSIFNFQFSINSKNQIFNFQNLFIILFILFWLFTIRQAALGQLDGTFSKREVPADYVTLKNNLVNDNNFYRTLWVPKEQRFAYASDMHPVTEAGPLFSVTDAATLKKKLLQKNTESYLADLGVKYLIIPDDVYGEIFLDDRRYSQKMRDSYEKVLDSIPWLKKVQAGKLTIYQTQSQKDLFWLNSSNGRISYQEISPTTYKVSLKNVKKDDMLVFSETFNPYWQATIALTNNQLKDKQFDGVLNSFLLSKNGNYTVTINFAEENYYLNGRIISLITLQAVILLLFFRKNNSK